MGKSHWEPALQYLEDASVGVFGPHSFRDYLQTEHDSPPSVRTATEISIDTRTQLRAELESADTMVLRLGSSPNGTGSQFALVKAEDSLDDFFLQSSTRPKQKRIDLSAEGSGEDELECSAEDFIDVYRMLPKFSESSFVNFAFAIGLFSDALGLDTDRIGTAPATLSTRFDFEFSPHPRVPTRFHHNNGQVEIDALVSSRRAGKRLLLVVEAKTGKPQELAKHKLAYPAMGIAQTAGDRFDEIVPVYLQAREETDKLTYEISECTFDLANDADSVLSDLSVSSTSQYEVTL